MALARYNGVATALDSNGFHKIAPFAVVTVRREDTGALATLKSDRAGLVGLSNPMTADQYGRFSFCVAGLAEGYRITVTEAASPGLEYTHRNVPIGLFAEQDNPITTKGDIMIGSASGATARKAIGTDGYPLVPAAGSADGALYLPPALGYNLVGGYLDWSAAGSPTGTLSVSIKTWSGVDPSVSEPVFIAFRSSTAGTGSLTYRKITDPTSITINDTALLGTASGVPFRLWCVAFNDGTDADGTIRLALINCLTTSANAGSGRNVDAIYPLSGWGIASATLEDNGADSAGVFYSSGASVSAKAYATLGFGEWGELGSPPTLGLPNAGNWNSNPSRIQLFGPGVPLPGQPIQCKRTATGAVATGSTALPADDSIPQNTEGDQYMSQAITPSSPANVLLIDVNVQLSSTVGDNPGAALFQDSTANALAAMSDTGAQGASVGSNLKFRHMMLAGTGSATTMKVRAGYSSGTTTFNGASGTRRYGAVMASELGIEELMG